MQARSEVAQDKIPHNVLMQSLQQGIKQLQGPEADLVRVVADSRDEDTAQTGLVWIITPLRDVDIGLPAWSANQHLNN